MGQEEFITEKRKRKELTQGGRYKLEHYLRRGDSIQQISSSLLLHPRTIRREISKGTVKLLDTHLCEYECYKADYAQRIHDAIVVNRGRKFKIVSNALMIHIRDRLRNKYSPDFIIGEVKRDVLFYEIVCAKTLYNWLQNGCVSGFKMSKHKRVVRKRRVGLKNPNAKRIDERQPGHWEMDTVVGSKGDKACLLVLTERHSRTQESVLEVFDRLERRYKSKFSEIFNSITSDNGSEFLNWEDLELFLLARRQTN